MNEHRIRTWLCRAVVMIAVGAPRPAQADEDPTGLWFAASDDGSKNTAVVEITRRRGMLTGKVVRLIISPDPDPRRDKCSGARKGKRIIGMEIIWGLRQIDSEWAGERILDPENGKEYDCTIAVIAGGGRLKVRGFWGIALIGRTQYWRRTNQEHR